MTIRAAIRDIASHFPEQRLTNEALAAEMGDWDAEKILAKTGIAERRIAAPDECASDLGVAAARKLFDRGGCGPKDVDFLLFCTQSPDYFLPTTACLIQERLGLPTHCGAIDFNQGCSGFVYGLALAKSLVETGTARNVLLITAETYSKFLNPKDRSVRTIFGDAAAATLISGIETDRELIGPFVFGTDGRGAEHLIVPAGGMRKPRQAETRLEREAESGNWRSEDNLYMNGGEIFSFTLQVIPGLVDELLAKSGRARESVDYFFFHQANAFMLKHLRTKMKLPAERFWIDVESCGNTVSSTIPIAMSEALARGVVHPGEHTMLVGFGVGLSWAATMVEI